ncbi:MAG TPA: 2-C-methyl-D-erythritol 2,4-cyclodiphosphate synthase, partial [Trueperaceae bacterium]|nr:2-C-methyl-D-erythritol 2,4-cyclodiphosphate synthase [Trueperaceae bacterium]
MPPALRIGHGQDAHRLAPGRPLVVGGVAVSSERGADAHSDGDV